MQGSNVAGGVAAIYTRVSGMEQDQGASPNTQLAECQTKAIQLGYQLDPARVYHDVHTGTDFFERQRLTSLRGVVRRRDVAAVVCHSMDRLSRDQTHLGVFLMEAQHYGVEVHFVLDEYDDSMSGQMMAFVKGIAGKIEHERLRDRTRRGREGRLDKGLPLAGPRPPYGYRWVDANKSRLEFNPETEHVARRIFSDVARGTSARQVAIALTREGIPTATGGEVWTPQTITRLLRNPVYVGSSTSMRTEYYDERVPGVGRVRKARQRTEGTVLLPDVAPALVSAQIADAAVGRLAVNKREATRNNPNPEAFLLRAGYARCGYCGSALTVHWIGGRPYYGCYAQTRYGCPHHAISTSKLDQAVWSRVEKVLADPTVVGRELERLHEEDPTSGDAEAYERRLREVERKQRNLVSRLAAVEDEDLAALVQAELATLTAQGKVIKTELADLVTRRDTWKQAQGRLNDLEAWCRDVSTNLGELDYSGRRLAISALGVTAKLWRSDHHPRYEIEMKLDIVEPSGC